MENKKLQRDKALFHRIARGDKDAYTIIFLEYYGKVYSKALFICKIPATAKDIAQQVFLKLWEKKEILSSVDYPETWLLQLARNQVLDTLKRTAHQDKYVQYIKEVFQEEQASPERLLIHRQRSVLIRQSLAELTPRQREVYLLHREEGYTYQEIAEQLHMSRDTVKEHLSNALTRIRKFLLKRRDELLLLIAFFIK